MRGLARGAGAGEWLRAGTSITVLADLIRNVGGERVEATALMPYGDKPEDYDPTPVDAVAVGHMRGQA